jgi:Family of unknown function (DUF5946)
MGTCPGCGVMMPGSTEPWDPRSLASEACHQLYGEVVGYESQNIVELGRWHQLLVDTYAAQHVGPRRPAIGTAFALIGLHLALEVGWDGLAVRDAHQRLANRFRNWPPFAQPAHRGIVTVHDLARAGLPTEHVAQLRAWAEDVWAAWADEHAAIVALVRERLAPASGPAAPPWR